MRVYAIILMYTIFICTFRAGSMFLVHLFVLPVSKNQDQAVFRDAN